MAATLEKRFGAAVELVKGSRGAFEVSVDGHLVFSKLATHRFPDDAELDAHFR